MRTMARQTDDSKGNLLVVDDDLVQRTIIGKIGARSSAHNGFSVPGCSGGAIGVGKSATMLYHASGMRFCGRLYWMDSMEEILTAPL